MQDPFASTLSKLKIWQGTLRCFWAQGAQIARGGVNLPRFPARSFHLFSPQTERRVWWRRRRIKKGDPLHRAAEGGCKCHAKTVVSVARLSAQGGACKRAFYGLRALLLRFGVGADRGRSEEVVSRLLRKIIRESVSPSSRNNGSPAPQHPARNTAKPLLVPVAKAGLCPRQFLGRCVPRRQSPVGAALSLLIHAQTGFAGDREARSRRVFVLDGGGYRERI